MIVTLDAIKRREDREFRFHAAIQGVDLEGGEKADKTFEDVMYEARAAELREMPEPERFQARGIQFEVMDG